MLRDWGVDVAVICSAHALRRGCDGTRNICQVHNKTCQAEKSYTCVAPDDYGRIGNALPATKTGNSSSRLITWMERFGLVAVSTFCSGNLACKSARGTLQRIDKMRTPRCHAARFTGSYVDPIVDLTMSLARSLGYVLSRTKHTLTVLSATNNSRRCSSRKPSSATPPCIVRSLKRWMQTQRTATLARKCAISRVSI